jgi:hypothetical protein
MTTCPASVPVMVLFWAATFTTPADTNSNLLRFVTLDPSPPSNSPGPFQTRQ